MRIARLGGTAPRGSPRRSSALPAHAGRKRRSVVHSRWAVAFGFGSIHGFGFASVLGELGLPTGARLLAIFGFNAGVEVGQLAIVAVAVPAAFAIRNTPNYQRALLPVGSLGVAAVAAVWLVQRIAG